MSEAVYRDIVCSDVNAMSFEVDGVRNMVSSFMGRIMRQDVGKRVFAVWNEAHDSRLLVVENDEQLARRMGWDGPACVLELPEPPLMACPNCGSTSDWWADYYEATRQSIEIRAWPGDEDDPEKLEIDYTGNTSYSDASTEDERYVCRRCEYEIVLGTFSFVPKD